ncbi:MAG: 1-aminocyclopropane-1-carboxylate deaminase/D-cysteine desulfhydrase [Bacteroidia bacterium]|nr:1-aminocyclopropane-1-carboxylate deaminase/D-cysteine desulfhydrase [Bacteroidia bacterium]
MDEPNFIPPLQQIIEPFLDEKGIRLFMLRTDQNHPEISGNKLYKLKYNLIAAREQKKDTILTFGGAFSNHIAATAAAGKEYGFKTIGIIRGEESSKNNPTLSLAKANGMHLHFVSRELYRDKAALLAYTETTFGKDVYIVPEGGSNTEGVKGCMKITSSISIPFDIICCACGTGATASGIILSLKEGQKALGFQVLKAENYIQQEVKNWLERFGQEDKNNWQINEDFHFGGYAKTSPELSAFIKTFQKKHQIQLDHVYTAKMMYGIMELIQNDHFPKNSTIIAVHTGGLQGNKGFDD